MVKGGLKQSASFFNNLHINSDLKKKSLRGGAVTITSQAIMFVVGMLSTMILARLLTPQDYGLIAMVASITGFAAIFSDLGLSTATIQRENISHEQVSTLFWINVSVGAVLTLLVICVAPLVSWFYGMPELFMITVVLSFNFIIRGFAIQNKALLNRKMAYLKIAAVEIIATLSGIITSVIIAKLGYGYWALISSTLTISVISVVGFWLSSRWIPGVPKRNAGVRSMLGFGSDIAGFNVVNFFSRNLDNILIGRYVGAAQLGLYSKAYQLLLLPISMLKEPLNKVALPSLSRLQNDPVNYRYYYTKYLSVLAFVSMPLVVYMFTCSENLIGVVLGDQWIAASDIFKILSIAALIQPVASTRGLLLLSTGKSRKYLWWGVAFGLVTAVSFIVGLRWGVRGVATSYTIANYLVLYPSLRYIFRDNPVKTRDFFLSISKPLLSSLAMGAGCIFIKTYLVNLDDIVILILCLLSSVIIYILSFLFISGGTRTLREYYSYAKIALSRK